MAAHTANVSLATPDDIPSLIRIFWEAFTGPAESTFPQTDGGRAWLERSFQSFLGKQSYYRPESKVPVVRSPNEPEAWFWGFQFVDVVKALIDGFATTGRPVALAIVHIVKPGQTVVGSSWKRRWGRVDDLPDVSEERLADFFEPLAKAHLLAVGKEEHVYIEFLMTRLTWRHKGYATALVSWVTELADDLGYACYLDGGGRGMGILERAGFKPKDIGHRYKETTPPCVPMLRPKKGM